MGWSFMYNRVKKGSWYMKSKSDPRWNCSGKEFVGGFALPLGMQAKLKEFTTKYGEQPVDLVWHYEYDEDKKWK